MGTLKQNVDQFEADVAIAHDLVHGPASGAGSTVMTDGGELRTFAKLLSDNQVAIDGKADSATLAGTAGSTLVGHGTETVAQALDIRLPEIGTYALLEAYAGPVTAFHVVCREHIFDGAHGVFRVVEGDTTSADNGGTILVDALGRRWRRDFSGDIDARWFGVLGSGVDESASLVAALALGRRVVIPDGVTVTASAFTVPQYSALIAGGERSGLALTGGITMSSNSKLLGLNISGGAFNAVSWSGKNKVTIEGCTISLTASTHKAILATGANSKNKIRFNTITAGGRAVDFTGSNSEIYRNEIDSCGNLDACILVYGDASAQSNRVDVCRNVITNSVGIGHGIQIYGGDADAVGTAGFVYYVSGVTASGNHLYNLSGAGIWTSIARNVVVSKNDIAEVRMEGIDFEGSKNCNAIGNTLLNSGAEYGALAVFHGSANCAFVSNAVSFEGKNTAFASGSCHTETGPIGTSSRNSSSYWGYVRDDCNNIVFERNIVSNDATSNLTEFAAWKGASANHSTRGTTGLELKNNTISGGCIAIQESCDDVEIVGNTLRQTFNTIMPIQVQRCRRARVKGNKIAHPFAPLTATPDHTTDALTATDHGLANGSRVVLITTGTMPAGLTGGASRFVVNATTDTFQVSSTVGGAAETFTDNGSGTLTVTQGGVSISQAAIRVGQFNSAPQRTTGIVIEANDLINYAATGIGVDSFYGGAPNPDGSGFAIRGNKCHNVYYSTTGTQRIIEQNHRPDTFAAATETAS